MVGQQAIKLLQAAGERGFDCPACPGMQLAPSLQQNVFVGRIARQGMLEHVLQLWKALLLAN